MITPQGAPHTWPGVLGALLREGHLDEDAAAWAMGEIMSGEATSAQIAGFAVAMRSAGEAVDAVSGLARTMLAKAAPADLDVRCVDIVGTGGDQAHTVNISTMAAIIVAAVGVPVAKHGNRAASSKCGAADLLEEFGIKLALDGAGVAHCVREVGIGFYFAPQFHSGFRFTGPARKELGIPTVFNFLGPLSNPAAPSALAVGCADTKMAPILAEVLARRGSSALVFRGDDGLDELTTTTTSQVWVAAREQVRRTVVDPARLGIGAATPEDLRGGDPAHNASVAHELFAGRHGPVRDAVLLNAAAAIAAYDGLSETAGDLDAALSAGIDRAADAIDRGAASELLTNWIRVSNS